MEQSPSIAALAEALAQVQQAMKPAPKENENPFFKSSYADLATISKTVLPLLSAHGLSVSQVAEGEGSVTTVLMHKSGEWLRGTLTLKPVKNDPQGMGSAITYARRYALAAICGLSTEDDDGNAATHDEPPKTYAKKSPSFGAAEAKRGDSGPTTVAGQTASLTPASTSHPVDAAVAEHLGGEAAELPVGEGDRKRLVALVKKHAVAAEAVGQWLSGRYGVQKATDLTRAQFDELTGRIVPGIGAGTVMPVDITKWPAPLANTVQP